MNIDLGMRLFAKPGYILPKYIKPHIYCFQAHDNVVNMSMSPFGQLNDTTYTCIVIIVCFYF